MKLSAYPWSVVAVAVVLGAASAHAVSAQAADERGVVLPTLLIRGELVSVDANDPTATLVKVKDRYGFETPIYLTTDTNVTQADQVVASASLATGKEVEIEYNFDVNTAKRHAVNVKLEGSPAAAAATPAPVAAVPGGEMEAPAESGPDMDELSEDGGDAAAEDATPASGSGGEVAAPVSP